ncbi:MAG: DUF1906 domain-containing protein [Acidobacteriaceae bacterium]|nr:DUF1906 domain-containing protein [Acidobacteriaceae bacterium]
MRSSALVVFAASLSLLAGCSRAAAPKEDAGEVAWDQSTSSTAKAVPVTSESATTSANPNLGFDRNDYPGDDTMAAMRKQFGFTGFWINNPPGATSNNWHGKRTLLRGQGWGFLVLFNGRLDAEILKSQKKGTAAAELGRKDASAAVAAAKVEGFPAGTILFLDQEEGGRLLDEQAAYLLAWTEGVATSGYKPGVYASAQPVSDEPGTTIDTVRDIRTRVKAQHLHEIAMFAAQDQCPPAPGCTAAAKPLSAAGEPDLIAWQYAQSPRRPEITRSCAQTYAADGNCYAKGFPGVFLDMDIASSPDPSHGR